MSDTRGFLERFYERLGAGDVAGLTALYGPDAEIIRYDAVATTSEEVAAYFEGFLSRHPGASLQSVDQVRDADDVLMWDALVDTDAGVLQVVNVVVFDDDGLVRRHIPGIRGYWGR
jgi:predicted SnoaL-like aldol condensation-catalyzing enzyme